MRSAIAYDTPYFSENQRVSALDTDKIPVSDTINRITRREVRPLPVGDTIRQLREALGWTLDDLARECQTLGLDVDKNDLSRYERGIRLIDAERVLPIIARALGLATPNDLGEWDDWHRPDGKRWGKR